MTKYYSGIVNGGMNGLNTIVTYGNTIVVPINMNDGDSVS